MINTLISHISRYVSLSESEINLLQTYLEPIHLNKKEILHQSGKICKSRYFISKGCLRSYFINNKGVEQILQLAIENWWISDYESLEQGIVSDLSIQAVEECEVIVFAKKDEDFIFQEIPKLERYFRLVQERDRTAAWTKIKYMHSFTQEEFYKHFLKYFPEFIERVPNYMIASFLGFTPEYLSEIRRRIVS